MGGFGDLKGYQTPKPPIKYGSIMQPGKKIEVNHIPGIINPSNIFTKEIKDNTHFINIRDSMMVSLQVLLKYSHNVLTHIIYANKLLPYYSIQLEHTVPDSLELKTGIPEHVVPKKKINRGSDRPYKTVFPRFISTGGC